eukprot:2892688-Heterocapsa_arctica.AAC.1
MLGPQDPPRMAVWCSESSGSTMGPTVSMIVDPNSLRFEEGSCKGRWLSVVSTPAFLGIQSRRSSLGPRMLRRAASLMLAA